MSVAVACTFGETVRNTRQYFQHLQAMAASLQATGNGYWHEMQIQSAVSALVMASDTFRQR